MCPRGIAYASDGGSCAVEMRRDTTGDMRLLELMFEGGNRLALVMNRLCVAFLEHSYLFFDLP